MGNSGGPTYIPSSTSANGTLTDDLHLAVPAHRADPDHRPIRPPASPGAGRTAATRYGTCKQEQRSAGVRAAARPSCGNAAGRLLSRPARTTLPNPSGDQSGVRYTASFTGQFRGVQRRFRLRCLLRQVDLFSGSGFWSSGDGSRKQSASAHVSYALMVVALENVTISTLGGTTPDSSGNQHILVGQQCTGTVNGIPAALQPYATYKWSVSGTWTFQDWEPTTPAFPKASPPTLCQSAGFVSSGRLRPT